MDRRNSRLIAIGTIAMALGIGGAMQYMQTQGGSSKAQAPLEVSDVQEVSSTPRNALPEDRPGPAELPAAVVSTETAPVQEPEVSPPSAPDDAGFACEVDMTATPAAGAMMTVRIEAPCHGSERVTLHHSGLMFTDLMQPDGTLQVDVPALDEAALVIASFMDGGGAVAHTEVTSVPFYDRVVLQWRGAAGLQLHAREFDAEYFSDGHVWQGAGALPARAASGKGGFLTKLGSADAPNALLAEVYTFPTGVIDAEGTVALTVETEILSSNCDSVVEAQTLEIRGDSDLVSKELTIDVPGCDAVGDFLMLKNIVEDLTIAAK